MKSLLLILLLLPFLAKAQLITTFAGDTCGVAAMGGCFSGDSGQARDAGFYQIESVRRDRRGNFYITDCSNSRIRKVDTAGIVTTITGDGTNGYGGDGWYANLATISVPEDIAIDKKGNIYFVDGQNDCVREIMTDGFIVCVIGTATVYGYAGDSGVATAAKLADPVGMAIDTIGNIYVADWGNSVIRKVDTFGIITTFAGNGTYGYSGDSGVAIHAQMSNPCYMTFDRHNNLYFTDPGNNCVRKINPAGIITTYISGLNSPVGITIDTSGNMYVSEQGTNTIQKITPAGVMTLYAGSGTAGYSGDGGPAIACEFNGPQNMCTDDTGHLYIADFNNNCVRKIYDTTSTPLYTHSLTRPVNDLKIFPNPAITTLTIQSANNITEVTIMNLMGQTVYSKPPTANCKLQTIDVATWPRGIYFVKVNGVVQKFVKE